MPMDFCLHCTVFRKLSGHSDAPAFANYAYQSFAGSLVWALQTIKVGRAQFDQIQ